jgi:hypothetical protein
MADDGGPNTDFWLEGNKVICLTVTNPEIFGEKYFLVFDYSPAIGESLGKPWSVVEKGKCYQIDVSPNTAGNSGTLYKIRVTADENKEKYSNYKSFSPSQDLDNGSSISQVWSPAELHYAVTVSGNNLLKFTGIESDLLFPTQYQLGYPFTIYSSSVGSEFGSILEDNNFIEVGKTYTSLAKNLQEVINKCDNRKRIEIQFIFDKDLKLSDSYVSWKINDGTNIIVSDSPFVNSFDLNKSLSALQTIGCQQDFANFINEKRSDFSTFDSMVKILIEKYPDLYESSYKSVIDRNPNDMTKIESFATLKPVPILTGLTLKPINNTQEKIVNNTPSPLPTSSLDEPTVEKKAEIVASSKNSLLKYYFSLPIIVVSGFLIYFLIKTLRQR